MSALLFWGPVLGDVSREGREEGPVMQALLILATPWCWAALPLRFYLQGTFVQINQLLPVCSHLIIFADLFVRRHTFKSGEGIGFILIRQNLPLK